MGAKTYLGFDYGTKRIGIAVGQSLTRTARDLDTLRNRRSDPDWDRILVTHPIPRIRRCGTMVVLDTKSSKGFSWERALIVKEMASRPARRTETERMTTASRSWEDLYPAF